MLNWIDIYCTSKKSKQEIAKNVIFERSDLIAEIEICYVPRRVQVAGVGQQENFLPTRLISDEEPATKDSRGG